MAVHRRFPLWTRPIPFFAGWAFLVLGIGYGFSWIWTTTVFSGNLLVQTRIPTQLIVFEGVKAVWLVVAFLALVTLVGFTFGSRRAALSGGLWAPRMRFFPTVALFGLFLAFFGAYWLFDLRLAFDDTLGGFVMFTSLNYANLLERPFIGTIGLALTLLGTVIFMAGSLDIRSPRPAPSRSPVAPPEPQKEAPRPSPRPAVPAATAAEPPQWLETGSPIAAKPAASAAAPKRAPRTRTKPTRKPAAAKSARPAAKATRPAAKATRPAAKAAKSA